jgi:hypothetical protein
MTFQKKISAMEGSRCLRWISDWNDGIMEKWNIVKMAAYWLKKYLQALAGGKDSGTVER